MDEPTRKAILMLLYEMAAGPYQDGSDLWDSYGRPVAESLLGRPFPAGIYAERDAIQAAIAASCPEAVTDR